MILDEAVNNLQTIPSKGSNCCKNQLYVQALVPKFLVRVSCIMTKFGDPHNEHLRKIICLKFLKVWKVLKGTWNQLRFILSSHGPPTTTLLSSLHEINFLTQSNLVFIEELHSDKTLSCQANQLLGTFKKSFNISRYCIYSPGNNFIRSTDKWAGKGNISISELVITHSGYRN
jgi:hypothetical protein